MCANPQAPAHIPPSGALLRAAQSSPRIAPPRGSPRPPSSPSLVSGIPGALSFSSLLVFSPLCCLNHSHLSFQLTFQGEDVEVKEMMATWTLQKGIPLVVVEREGRSLRLRQERFLSGVFKEDPAWRALQERWLLVFCRSHVPQLSLLDVALTSFQLLWRPRAALSHRDPRPQLALITFKELQVAQAVLFTVAFRVLMQPPLETQF